MKLTGKIIAAALLAGAMPPAGCYSLQHATVRATDQEIVLATNDGWFLFDVVPLACGNASADPWTPWAFFRNDVTMDKVQSRFMAYASERDADVSDIGYTISDSVMLNIPGLNLPLPIPYLLSYHEVQLSGVLTKRTPIDESGVEEEVQ